MGLSLLDSRQGIRLAERRTGPRGCTYLHLRKSSSPSAGGLICNSISHNVISLAFTHLADTDDQARCIMKYRTRRRPSDLSHLAFSPSPACTHDRKLMAFILRGSRCIAFCVHTRRRGTLCVLEVSITERTGASPVLRLWLNELCRQKLHEPYTSLARIIQQSFTKCS